MNEQELTIKINTLANTIGLEKTAAALEGMAVKARSVGTATARTGQQVAQVGQQATQAGEQGAGGMNIMSAATAALNGNVAGTASALVPLITKISALKTAITSVSLVAAGLTVLYTAFSKISEYAAKAAETVAAFNLKSRQDMIDAVTNAYTLQAIALERIGRIRDAELERQKAENEANKEFELATARQAKLKELQGTTDETGRAQIEAKYARVEQQITGRYDSKNDEAEFARIKKREEELRKSSESNARQISQKQALLRGAEKSATEAEGATENLRNIKPTSLLAWGMSRRMIGVKETEATDSRKQAEKLRDEIEALKKDRDAIADEINRNVGLQPSIQKRMGAANLGRANATAAMDLSDADRKRAEREALRPALAELDTETADLHPTDQAAIVAELRQWLKEEKLTSSIVLEYVAHVKDQKKAFNDQLARGRNAP